MLEQKKITLQYVTWSASFTKNYIDTDREVLALLIDTCHTASLYSECLRRLPVRAEFTNPPDSVRATLSFHAEIHDSRLLDQWAEFASNFRPSNRLSEAELTFAIC